VPTLAAKLGFTPETRGLVVGAAPAEIVDQFFAADRRPTAAPYDVILAFCPDVAALHHHVERLAARLATTGGLWLCWPKRSSGFVTDVTEAAVRACGLDAGLVDNKIAAIDETWSALRFVRRLADR
jgi:hypothetical protein